MADWEDYVYPGTNVLRNKLGIQDKEELQRTENLLVELRLREGCPEGNFDLAHIQAIHRHLFQDVYEWAGELRQVDMFKNERGEYSSFGDIESEIRAIHQRVLDADFLRNTNVWEFSAGAAEIIGDINHAHPFREGNTRTQLQFLQQLGEQAGHNIDLTKIDRDPWNEAKMLAGRGSYGAMNDQIGQAIVMTREKAPSAETERAIEPQATLPPEELATLREALAIRQEKERRELIEKHKAEREEMARGGDKQGLEKLIERHAVEIFAQDKLHKEELPRYIREREEAQRLREEMEERERLSRDLGPEEKARGRSR